MISSTPAVKSVSVITYPMAQRNMEKDELQADMIGPDED